MFSAGGSGSKEEKDVLVKVRGIRLINAGVPIKRTCRASSIVISSFLIGEDSSTVTDPVTSIRNDVASGLLHKSLAPETYISHSNFSRSDRGSLPHIDFGMGSMFSSPKRRAKIHGYFLTASANNKRHFVACLALCSARAEDICILG